MIYRRLLSIVIAFFLFTGSFMRDYSTAEMVATITSNAKQICSLFQQERPQKTQHLNKMMSTPVGRNDQILLIR